MKLELKHIAPYLPYGLKIFTDYDGIQEINGMPDLFHASYYCEKTDAGDEPHIEQIKPILRPLSDLTKEIEVNGEKFVPMIKLLYLYETNFFHEEELLKCIIFDIDSIISCEHKKYELLRREDFIVTFKVETSNMGTLVYSFTYDPKIRRFAYRDETNSRPLGVAFQYDLFQLLFEWHFDVFGLIEQGLAIDLNTL